MAELTRRAMEGELSLEQVFAERLRLLQPTRADLEEIARLYCAHLVPDARAVIAALRAMGCRMCIVSGGLLDDVKISRVPWAFPRAMCTPCRCCSIN